MHLRGVGVSYPTAGADIASLTGSLGGLVSGGRIGLNRRSVNVDALENIDLDLKPGDRVSLIGANGSGKTTLLSVLAGVLPPTSGEISCAGRIASLLSLQAGFETRATGLENIEIRARLMGVHPKSVHERTPEIIRFAELGDYINMPISTYSSGMKFRLAFSIATSFDPEIVLMDEWLSTGDQTFKDRAERRLQGLIEKASILVIASHNRQLHQKLCNKGLLLVSGCVYAEGGLDSVFETFDKEVLAPARAL